MKVEWQTKKNPKTTQLRYLQPGDGYVSLMAPRELCIVINKTDSNPNIEGMDGIPIYVPSEHSVTWDYEELEVIPVNYEIIAYKPEGVDE